MSSKVNSIEERVKLPPTDSVSRCYQTQQGNRKVIRILTVAVYVLCVSLAAIMLSLYYIFIWDPTIRPFVTKSGTCDKIIIPEKIAIRLLNSSEVTAEQFYKHILDQYRILYQLQQQRQQFLAKQHLQLQQLAAGNKFQEIFATATIIQAPPNERPQKPLTHSNNTFLLDPSVTLGETQQMLGQLPILDTHQTSNNNNNNNNAHTKRKAHRKHNNNGNNFHTHRRMHKNHNVNNNINNNNNDIKLNKGLIKNNNNNYNMDNNNNIGIGQALNEPIITDDSHKKQDNLLIAETYTSIPIPLILNSNENKPNSQEELRINSEIKRRTTTPTYLNPLLTGELIFEK